MNYNDGLICGVCSGEKVLVEKSTGKRDLCPQCHGRGYVPAHTKLKEEGSTTNHKYYLKDREYKWPELIQDTLLV